MNEAGGDTRDGEPDPRRMAEIIAEQIERDIIDQGWPVGTVLGSEGDMIARYGVSRGTLREAVRIGNEVETLYTNGPAAGGGAFKSARDVVAVASVLLPRELARPQVRFVGA